MATPMRYPVTPDGRYFVVRGRLWRCTDPTLPAARRQALVSALMQARAAVGHALRRGDADAERDARAAVHAAKLALGERGPPWWDDGAPDFNRRPVASTPYAAWHARLPARDDAGLRGGAARPRDAAPGNGQPPPVRRTRRSAAGPGRDATKTL